MSKKNPAAEDVETSFEILATKLHTNRNFAPGAAEAYIRVKRAYKKLINRLESGKTSNKTESKKEGRLSSSQENNYYQENNTLNPQSDLSSNPRFSSEDLKKI